MGGKKKKWGENGGTENSPIFLKTKKMGNLKKIKKWAQNGGDEKTRPFLKNGDAKNKKNGPTPCGREKNQIFVFQKKKKDGEKMGARKKSPIF